MPTSHIKQYLEHYLAFHPSQEVKEMFEAVAIRSLAVSMVGVFEPIYLYTLGFAITDILLFYIAVYIGFFFVLPLGGRICRKHGYEHTMLFSSPFLILFYLSLFAIPFHPVFIGIAVISTVVHRVLYWPGYHANFATWMNHKESGKEVSNRFAVTAIASAIAPIIGSAVIVSFGFGALFIVVAVLIMLSNLPLLRTPEAFIPKKFSYTGAVKRFVKRFGSARFLTYFALGESFIALAIWPVFIVIAIPNLLAVGVVVALARFINVIVTLYVGRLTDEDSKGKILASGTVFTVGSWIVRPFVTGPLGVFLSDSYYKVARNMIVVPFHSMGYNFARKEGVMTTIIFHEMCIAFGKLSAAVLCLLAFTYVPGNPWTVVFVIAAMFTALYSLLPYSAQRVTPETVVEHDVEHHRSP
jgi:MFS family permease